MWQNTAPKPVSNAMRLRNRRYSWLEPEKKLMIEKVSNEMRANYTSIEILNPLDFKDDAPTSVEWGSTVLKSGQPCAPHIKFKVIVFKNANRYQRYIYAEPAAGQDGKFLRRPATFKIVEVKSDQTESTQEMFASKQATHFELSLTDNRIVKFALPDPARGDLLGEYTIIFTSVHKKHQFIELFNLHEEGHDKKVITTQGEET